MLLDSENVDEEKQLKLIDFIIPGHAGMCKVK